MTRNDCLARDAADPLAPHRAAFALPPGVIYLDGNSLGALPATTAARVDEVVRQEWGRGLIGSWNAAGWIDRPARVGARIAELIGAQAEEVICADSTSRPTCTWRRGWPRCWAGITSCSSSASTRCPPRWRGWASAWRC